MRTAGAVGCRTAGARAQCRDMFSAPVLAGDRVDDCGDVAGEESARVQMGAVDDEPGDGGVPGCDMRVR